MCFHVNLNFSEFNKKVHLLVSEQYIDSIMHGATTKVKKKMKYERLEVLVCNVRYTLNKSETYSYFQFKSTVCNDKYSNIIHGIIITQESCWNVLKTFTSRGKKKW